MDGYSMNQNKWGKPMKPKTEKQMQALCEERLKMWSMYQEQEQNGKEIVIKKGHYKLCKITEKAIGLFEHTNKVLWIPKSQVKAITKVERTNKNGVTFPFYAVYISEWFCRDRGIFYNGGMMHYLEDVQNSENYVETI